MSYPNIWMDLHSDGFTPQGIVIDLGYENLNLIIEQVSNKKPMYAQAMNIEFSTSFGVSGK